MMQVICLLHEHTYLFKTHSIKQFLSNTDEQYGNTKSFTLVHEDCTNRKGNEFHLIPKQQLQAVVFAENRTMNSAGCQDLLYMGI